MVVVEGGRKASLLPSPGLRTARDRHSRPDSPPARPGSPPALFARPPDPKAPPGLPPRTVPAQQRSSLEPHLTPPPAAPARATGKGPRTHSRHFWHGSTDPPSTLPAWACAPTAPLRAWVSLTSGAHPRPPTPFLPWVHAPTHTTSGVGPQAHPHPKNFWRGFTCHPCHFWLGPTSP